MNKDNPKFLILGNGMLGQEYASFGHDVLSSKHFRVESDFTLDDTHEALLKGLVDAKLDVTEYDGIVNCIGISDTRYCEDSDNWSEVSFVNGILPGHLSQICNDLQTKFIHISTGCLYEQPHRPQGEDESLAAHCNYVVSKWQGELNCDKENDIIIRPRLLFGERSPAKGKRNNLILKLEKFNKFVDAFDSITWIRDIVVASEALVHARVSGAYNVACPEPATMYQIATGILGFEGEKITPEQLRRSQDLHLVNNVMDVSKVEQYCKLTPLKRALSQCQNALAMEALRNAGTNKPT
jgi:dTDP-4-dehydrorhamnose reductase